MKFIHKIRRPDFSRSWKTSQCISYSFMNDKWAFSMSMSWGSLSFMSIAWSWRMSIAWSWRISVSLT